MGIMEIDLTRHANRFGGYTELRAQENRQQRIMLVNGNVVANSRSGQSGISARVFDRGAWGFASAASVADDDVVRTIEAATRNARFLGDRLDQTDARLPHATVQGEYDFGTARPRKSQEELLEYLRALDAHLTSQYPDLTSRTVGFVGLDMEKWLYTSTDSRAHSHTPRALVIVTLGLLNAAGEPIELYQPFGGRGQFEDVFDDPAALHAGIAELHRHLQNKRTAVRPAAGMHDVVLDSDLAGILAHEAIGHTTEADLVRAGSVAADHVGKQVASEKITLIDFAHSLNGETLPVPVFIDDEGVEGTDTVLIENGVLRQFMHNKESAAFFDVAPTGNARAYEFHDEPLIRMRNTAIMPGPDRLDEMIGSIERGYYLMKPSNGQADTTSEFMFGVTLGYEIVDGRLGNAITDTTISGRAFDVLANATMVGDEMTWSCAGMCGKKQIIPVGMGGPAIKTRVTIGGE